MRRALLTCLALTTLVTGLPNTALGQQGEAALTLQVAPAPTTVDRGTPTTLTYTLVNTGSTPTLPQAKVLVRLPESIPCAVIDTRTNRVKERLVTSDLLTSCVDTPATPGNPALLSQSYAILTVPTPIGAADPASDTDEVQFTLSLKHPLEAMARTTYQIEAGILGYQVERNGQPVTVIPQANRACHPTHPVNDPSCALAIADTYFPDTAGPHTPDRLGTHVLTPAATHTQVVSTYAQSDGQVDLEFRRQRQAIPPTLTPGERVDVGVTWVPPAGPGGGPHALYGTTTDGHTFLDLRITNVDTTGFATGTPTALPTRDQIKRAITSRVRYFYAPPDDISIEAVSEHELHIRIPFRQLPGRTFTFALPSFTVQPGEPLEVVADLRFNPVTFVHPDYPNSPRYKHDPVQPQSASMHQRLTAILPAPPAPLDPGVPGPADPDPSLPGPTQPGPSQPGPNQPGPNQPDLDQPGHEQPGANGPGFRRPGPEQPGSANPDPSRPGPNIPAQPVPAPPPAQPNPGERLPELPSPEDRPAHLPAPPASSRVPAPAVRGRLSVLTDPQLRASRWVDHVVPEGQTVDTVLIGRDNVFADSLASGGLQGILDAPLLLNPVAELGQTTKATLARLKPKRVVLLGGKAAVSLQTEAQLQALGYQVTRLYGRTRVETAINAAATFAPSATHGILARAYAAPNGPESQGFADALSGGALAAYREHPVLLTPTEGLPQTLRTYLIRAKITHLTLLGSTEAISTKVEAELNQLGITTTRMAGENRADTAVRVAQAMGYWHAGESEAALVVNGDDEDAWTDAFPAALYAKRHNLPVVLSASTSLKPESAQWLGPGVHRTPPTRVICGYSTGPLAQCGYVPAPAVTT